MNLRRWLGTVTGCRRRRLERLRAIRRARARRRAAEELMDHLLDRYVNAETYTEARRLMTLIMRMR